ncbi:DUF3570 domain-containing protein [Flavobacterium sp. HXWNR69]|uniref:DUF3570 domain-containing protein n=1 Tax=Flavobacterium fragile TaxID=2949085 RepID=A0ABT0TGZ4_9FLAO|nr:DUF3570 domain-containing protein [Flavobacterium sp. HXWNR69]MCL9770246.1 DUF3570 domain-containing protein [Flavobacterium sp. HXWNR69]
MKKISALVLFFVTVMGFSQEKDSTQVTYKKRVLESIEVDFLMSYYKQDGIHSAVSGGSGMEKLTNITPTFIVAIPLNDDDVLTVDAGISAYSSASSGNINPFDSNTPSPWQASSGASAQDVLTSLVVNYSHSSDDRNTIWNGHISGSAEYDYSSIGFGGGVSRLFNGKNSEVSVNANVYLDTWRPIYPKELQDFVDYNGTNGGIYDEFVITPGQISSEVYNPVNYKAHDKKNRNSFALSFAFSQVMTKKIQGSIFMDVLYQNGLLSTPYQRVYFADKGDFFINEFKLADDIERLPDNRFKLPIGTRWNFYLNEKFTLRTYYRYYFDDWDISSHTFNVEIPYKLTDKFTVYPMYRYYTQQQSKYFAPYEEHVSTEKYYTSDYDLSTFKANQYGFGVSYTDIFTNTKIWKFGLKNIDFRYNHYDRNDGLSANIFTFGVKFVQ